MRRLKLIGIVFVLTVTLLAGGIALADRSSGGGSSKGGYSGGGGHSGGYSRGGGHSGGYSGKGGHKGGYYGGRGYYGRYYRGRGYGGYYGSAWFGWPGWYYPYYYPYYYSYSPYYYPYYSPVVSVPSEPQEYIEQPQRDKASSPPAVWYFCPDSKTYYPYVRECPGGWQTVPAQPPANSER